MDCSHPTPPHPATLKTPNNTQSSLKHKPSLKQVGIIALNLIGEPLRPAPEGPPGFLDTDGPVSHDVSYYNRAAGEVADLQLDVNVDTMTASRIKVGVERVCQGVVVVC